ncbi:MAG: PAS domain-containing sensor histidine kinase [Phycisphaerales bacterium]|nr:PAS domain-containing sensor histidine kinase [Phycisphaerales bacterium]
MPIFKRILIMDKAYIVGFLIVPLLISCLILLGINTHNNNMIVKDYNRFIINDVRSIEYCGSMSEALNTYLYSNKEKDANLLFNDFEINLLRQKKNATPGPEKKMTDSLEKVYRSFIEKNRIPDTIQFKNFILKNINQLKDILTTISLYNSHSMWIQEKQDQQKFRTYTKYINIFLTTTIILLSLLGILLFRSIKQYIASLLLLRRNNKKTIESINTASKIEITLADFDEIKSIAKNINLKLNEFEKKQIVLVLVKEQMQSIFLEKINDPLIAILDTNTIFFINESGLKIFNMNKEDMVNKNINTFIDNDLMKYILDPIETIDTMNIFFDDQESFFQKEIIPISIHDKFMGRYIILKNVTKLYQKDMKRNSFIANISNDIKESHNIIFKGMRILKGTITKESRDISKESINLIDNLAEQIRHIVDTTENLLDLAQTETGKIQLQLELVDPVEIMDYAYAVLFNEINQKEIHIIKQFKKVSKIFCNTIKTKWVVVNILISAIQRSNNNSEITLGIYEEKNQIILYVRDYGLGFNEDEQKRLFTNQYKQPLKEDKKATEFVINFGFIKDYIDAQKGEISCSSEPHVQTTFYIKFHKATNEVIV